MARPVAAALVAGALSLSVAGAADAQDRRLLGLAFSSSNDDFLTSEILDRWRSGALTVNLTYGPGYEPDVPIAFGDVLEFRFRGEILTPEDIDNPDPEDRPYAGSLAFGVHSHFRRAGTDLRLGGEVVVTGPQTGLSDLQESLHESQGLPDPSAAAEDQIGDATYLVVSGEASRPFPIGASTVLRPFLSLRAGDETFGRIGADLVGGSLASGGLLVRDYATGQLSEATRGIGTGFGWSLGVDVAQVADSIYLPDDRVDLTRTRTRGRASLMWAGARWSAFIGTSYLSEEFDAQDEGQVVGTFGLTLGF